MSDGRIDAASTVSTAVIVPSTSAAVAVVARGFAGAVLGSDRKLGGTEPFGGHRPIVEEAGLASGSVLSIGHHVEIARHLDVEDVEFGNASMVPLSSRSRSRSS